MAPEDDRFGLNLKRLREAAGFSQNELARKAIVSVTQISRLETGDSGWDHKTLATYAAALNVDVAEFLRPIERGHQRKPGRRNPTPPNSPKATKQ